MSRIVITAGAAVCGAGRSVDEIWEAIVQGRSAVARITEWDPTDWPVQVAAPILDYRPADLLGDRKLQKLVRRTDVLGIHAASEATAQSGLVRHRDGLDEAARVRLNDRCGIYVGTSGGTFDTQYDYFPLLREAKSDVAVFGRELAANVNPMWLLRMLPNNVLCHVGIRFGFKGPNGCIMSHAVAGIVAVGEAVAALRAGEADAAIVVGHDALIEPQHLLYYRRLGLLADDTIRPFDVSRTGSVFGEGAAAVVIETESAARERNAAVLAHCLGTGAANDGLGLLPLRQDGDGLARAITAALNDAGISPREVGMIVAHGNGTPQSDASESQAILRVFGDDPPPVTAIKAVTGHLFAASGILDALVAVRALNEGIVPGIPTLRKLDPACAGLPVSAEARVPRSDIALVLARGFAGMNAALVLRAGGNLQ